MSERDGTTAAPGGAEGHAEGRTLGHDRGAAGPMLLCEDVSRHFGALRAVDRLSFEIARGEVLGIGGPNGAGKTTLFDLISGLTRTTGGRISLDGVEITDLPPDRTCHLGLARTFQLNAGFETLSAVENVIVAALFGRRRKLFPGIVIDRAVKRRAYDALERVGLAERAHVRVEAMTVLDRKLLMVAGAIVMEPKLLMMDEPVGGLTPDEIARVHAVVSEIAAAGTTILLIEHVMQFLMSLSDRILIMHHGQKLFEGRPADMSRDPEVVRVYLGEKAAARLQRSFEADVAEADAATGEAGHA